MATASKSWRYYSYYVTPPAYSGRFAGKKREVGVYTPFSDAAMVGVGAQGDDSVVENRLSPFDRRFRELTVRKEPKLEEMVDFYDGMRMCLKMGLSNMRSIELVLPSCQTEILRGVLAGVYYKLRGGLGMSASMRYFPEVFDERVLALIEAGEQKGDLRPTFESLADSAGRDLSLIRKVKGAFMYPLSIVVMVLMATLILAFKVIPSFAESFKAMNMELPMVTRVVVGFSDFMVAFPYVLVLPAFLIYYLIKNRKRFLRLPIIEGKVLTLPIFGALIRGVILVRTLRTFALLEESGISITKSFPIVARVSGHKYYEEYFLEVGKRIARGEDSPSAFSHERARIPVEGARIATYVSIGKQANDLHGVLRRFASQLDENVMLKAEVLPKLLEPILITFIAVFVGGLMAAIFLPYFSLLTALMNS